MPFLLKLAWQDLRGSGQSLWVLCACLVLGVTLVAATGGLYRQVQEGLQADSRKLSGGDLQVNARSRLPGSRKRMPLVSSISSAPFMSVSTWSSARTSSGE